MCRSVETLAVVWGCMRRSLARGQKDGESLERKAVEVARRLRGVARSRAEKTAREGGREGVREENEDDPQVWRSVLRTDACLPVQQVLYGWLGVYRRLWVPGPGGLAGSFGC